MKINYSYGRYKVKLSTHKIKLIQFYTANTPVTNQSQYE